MKAEELSGTHLGLHIKVKGKYGAAEGILVKVEHGAALIEDAPLSVSGFFYPPALGQRWVKLEFSSGTLRVEPSAEVQVRSE